MMEIKFNFINFARLPQLGSMPAAYAAAVVAGGCDWPIQ